MTRRFRRGRAAASALLAVSLIGGLAACANDPLAEQYREGDNKGFIEGDFRVVEIPEAERGEAVSFSGVLDDGSTVTEADYAGEVLVVNFWYAACAPCRVEAPFLEAVHQEYADDGVSFLGVNTYDSAEASLAFAETYGVSYPSALAVEDGSIKLAFAERTPLNATPTTLVLDREGRVAARIIGQLEDASVLDTLVGELAGPA